MKIFPKEVIVTTKVEKYTEGELIIPIELSYPETEDSISIFPKKVFVKYRAPLSLFPKINIDDFSINATINKSDLTSNNNTVAFNINKQPDYTKIVSVQPEAIEFYLIKEVEILDSVK